MSDSLTSTENSDLHKPDFVTPRRWFRWVVVIALVVAAVVGLSVWAGTKINGTSNDAALIKKDVQAHTNELATLNTEVNTLKNALNAQKKGNAEVTKLLQLAGLTVAQLETQMSNLCSAINGALGPTHMCAQVNFSIPPAGTATPTTTTTTVPHQAPHIIVFPPVTTTTEPFRAPIATTTTSTTVPKKRTKGKSKHK